MKEPQNYILDFEVDKLTNSIENVSTGEKFDTSIMQLSFDVNAKEIKKSDWVFNWKKELQIPERRILN